MKQSRLSRCCLAVDDDRSASLIEPCHRAGITGAAFALSLLIASSVGAADLPSQPSILPPRSIEGPFVIETIYPSIHLEDAYLDQQPVAQDSYNFWGTDLVVSDVQLTVFNTPISYPYRFKQGGDDQFADKLKAIDIVDASSVRLGDAPNIPEGRQYEFRGVGLEDLLLKERFIEFRLRKWPDALFLKFPSFLVVQLMRTEPPIGSPQDYESLIKHWYEIVSDLPKQEELCRVLGISRTGGDRWRNVPNLVFVASTYFNDIDFHNRYLFGADPWADRTERFLREVSIRAPLREGKERSAFADSIFGCNDIVLEEGEIGGWKFYYSTESIFFDSSRLRFYVQGPSAPHLEFSRILRASLFANVVLPELVRAGKKVRSELEGVLASARMRRQALFTDTAPRTVRAQHSELIRDIVRFPTFRQAIRYLDDALDGMKQLRDYTKAPGVSPLQADLITRSGPAPNPIDPCVELYDFNRRFNVVNDRRKVDAYEGEIERLKASLQRTLASAEKEVTTAMELAENRKGNLESQKAAALAIALPSGLSSVMLGIAARRARRRSKERSDLLGDMLPLLGGTIAGLVWLVYLWLW